MHSTARHPRFLVPRRLIHYRHAEIVRETATREVEPSSRPGTQEPIGPPSGPAIPARDPSIDAERP
jgi:hypothetical protein